MPGNFVIRNSVFYQIPSTGAVELSSSGSHEDAYWQCAIESLIRQVVNLRLKANGKFWLQGNAEAILHARCQWAARTWSTFCDSILTARLYPA